jgi:hypothetical protein
LLTAEQLKQVIHGRDASRIDCLLLALAAQGGRATTAAVRDAAIAAGVKQAKTLNVSTYLSRAKGKAFNTPDGWELTKAGREHVAWLAAETLAESPAVAEARVLRDLLPKLKNADAREFLSEAIVCAEQSLFRAAVVLSWVGAMAILQDVAAAHHLTAFNTEASRRNPKWKAAKTPEDFGEMREATFLEIAVVASMLAKNVKGELEGCLKLRNACGHPTSLKIGAHKVAAHLETLALNVYAKYS